MQLVFLEIWLGGTLVNLVFGKSWGEKEEGKVTFSGRCGLSCGIQRIGRS